MASVKPAPSAQPASGSYNITARSTNDTILRNALRYTISAKEYDLLHKYIISRSKMLQRRASNVEEAAKMINRETPPRNVKDDKKEQMRAQRGENSVDGATSGGDYNARTVRDATRVFLVATVGMKFYTLIMERLMGQKPDSKDVASTKSKRRLLKSPSIRFGLSLSTILLLYRLLFRFLTRLRLQLLTPSAQPFRLRNPRAASVLTWDLTPAVGASFAGLALGAYPGKQLRVSIAIYALFRAAEFAWNLTEDGGMIWGWERINAAKGQAAMLVKRKRPWWWGSWLLQPLAFGQLLSAVVFDRDCFPAGYGDFIFKQSGTYLQRRPRELPASIAWPSTNTIVDSLAQMARLSWPPFVSPILFPNKVDTLPQSLDAITPLSAPAHPLITSLSCATLHPTDPSCLRTSMQFWIRSFPPFLRFFVLVNTAFLIPRYRNLYNYPLATIQRLLTAALRTSTFVTGSIATAWASICFFQAWFPRTLLPTQRFFLGGFIAGFWAWIERKHGRSMFLYSARTSLDSLWKVGVKRRWWKGIQGGDVWVFMFAMMVTGMVYERDARAVREPSWRKGVSWIKGQGFVDWAVEEDDEEETEQEDEAYESANEHG